MKLKTKNTLDSKLAAMEKLIEERKRLEVAEKLLRDEIHTALLKKKYPVEHNGFIFQIEEYSSFTYNKTIQGMMDMLKVEKKKFEEKNANNEKYCEKKTKLVIRQKKGEE